MIIVRIMGGIGNQMFQYALARSLQEKGNRVYLDKKRPYRNYEEEQKYIDRECKLQYFSITLKPILIERMKQWDFLRNQTAWDKVRLYLSEKGRWPFRFVREGDNFGIFKEEYLHFKEECYFLGTFQREEYFSDIRPILLKEFQPKKPVRLSSHIKHLLETRNTVSVHIRRGDYTSHVNQFGLCSKKYYKTAMEYMKKKVKDPVFLFFSDDLEWVREEITIEEKEEACYINEDRRLQDYEELLLMSYCSHNIIANSSFSWWGAYLNTNENKIVTAPKIWFRENPSYGIIPKEWIKI